MGCAIGCLALAFPRVALALVWLLGPRGYVVEAYPGILWPILGFIFLPATTLAFAFASHSLASGGHFTPLGWIVVIIAGLLDLGMLGGGGRAARRRKRKRD